MENNKGNSPGKSRFAIDHRFKLVIVREGSCGGSNAAAYRFSETTALADFIVSQLSGTREFPSSSKHLLLVVVVLWPLSSLCAFGVIVNPVAGGRGDFAITGPKRDLRQLGFTVLRHSMDLPLYNPEDYCLRCVRDEIPECV